jgi:CubicO group peptidase (beta-lactamase class C family)
MMASSSEVSVSGIKERLAALGPAIEQIRVVAGAPGVSVAVSHRGQVVHRASYGVADVETGRPVTDRTVYGLGTMAKALTASAVCILVDEGKLQWKTPVRAILPGFRSRSATVAENLTVVDLLCHRAGLARSNFWWQGAEGEIFLRTKEDLLRFYGELDPVGGEQSFRADWAYSNWGYAIVGAIIEELSGMSFADFLREKLFQPLGMHQTTFKAVDPTTLSDLAKPYAAMDDASPHLMPFPPVSRGETVMSPAMGGCSTADDLLRYSMALLEAHRFERSKTQRKRPPVIRHAMMQLAGHSFTGPPSPLEKSYAFGFYRSQLPSTVLGMGWNSIYVDKMPTLLPRGHAGPVIAHGGSLPGYHVAMALLPELDSSVVVCTNSIALGDVSGWVSLAVLEALMETPQPSDFVRLATEAARSNALNVVRLTATLQQRRKESASAASKLSEYVGRYRHPRHDWFIDVRLQSEPGRGLEVAFLGRESQTWSLQWYEEDTFLWLASREEQARRGRMTTYPLVPDHFKLGFKKNEQGEVDRLLWAHEAGLAPEQQVFSKEV